MIRVGKYSILADLLRATAVGVFASCAMVLGGPSGGSAQTADVLVVHGPDEATFALPVGWLRGYSTVPHAALGALGWAVEWDAPILRAQLGADGPVIEFSPNSPLFRWNEEMLQLVSAPFLDDGAIQIPLQFLIDFLPERASESYAFSSDESSLEVLDASLWRDGSMDERTGGGAIGGIAATSVVIAGSDDPVSVGEDLEDTQGEDVQDPEKRVIVIDPGHGGRDPGTTGAGGRREKDIALAIGRYLERELREEEDFEVYMTRDRDELVPLWERGPQATQFKGERPGLFISIHVNSSPTSPSVRGFETYFLSEARTEHERRVAAIENAPLELEAELDGGDGDDEDLTFILRELRNLDHQHWSSLLAEGIQAELENVHPGPNRGVKQGPLAVITNALMPAVLVEVGFISNRDEERILSSVEFQRGVAGAFAQAIRDFFERYPPEQGVTAQSSVR